MGKALSFSQSPHELYYGLSHFLQSAKEMTKLGETASALEKKSTEAKVGAAGFGLEVDSKRVSTYIYIYRYRYISHYHQQQMGENKLTCANL